MKWLTECYSGAMNRYGVDVRLDTEATPELIDSIKPDAVVIASGGVPVVPGILGIDGSNVYGIADVLGGKSGLEKKNVVVVGAGMTGIGDSGVSLRRRKYCNCCGYAG